jgi:tetratricopeptide (TPR) repeat protein
MRHLLLCFLVGLVFQACTCGRKSDEELLKEKIDATSVHLYLATKIAILKADQSPEAKHARDELFRAIAAVQGTQTKDGEHRLSASDVLALSKALYSLKSEGKELLESGDEKGMAPILPKLFDPPPELAAVLDLNLEHALLLTALFGLKFHPQSPTPVPNEILLYEAWMTKPGDVMLPGVQGFFHAIKAVVYGQNELCDLAQSEAKSASDNGLEPAKMAAAIGVVSGGAAQPSDDGAKKFDAALRVLAHGACATCFLQREEKDKALDELDKTATASEDMGAPPGETALLRGYIAFERGDKDAATKYLEQARDYEGRSAEAKKDIEELLRELDDDDMEKYFGRGFFAVFTARLAVRELDRAGAFRGLDQSELGKTLDGYLGAASGALGKAKDMVPGKGCVGGDD